MVAGAPRQARPGRAARPARGERVRSSVLARRRRGARRRHATATTAWLDVLARARDRRSARPESRFDREPEYVFRHALVREAAYATLTDADRALGHRLAGAWLEPSRARRTRWCSPSTSSAVRSRRAPRCTGSAPPSRRWKATTSRARSSTRGAASRATRRSDRAARLGVIRSEAHRWRGELAQSRVEAQAATDAAPEDTAVWYQAVSQLAYASMAIGDTTHSSRSAKDSARQAPSPEDPASRRLPRRALARRDEHGVQRRTDLADRVHERMDEALADAVPSEAALARVRLSTGMRAYDSRTTRPRSRASRRRSRCSSASATVAAACTSASTSACPNGSRRFRERGEGVSRSQPRRPRDGRRRDRDRRAREPRPASRVPRRADEGLALVRENDAPPTRTSATDG